VLLEGQEDTRVNQLAVKNENQEKNSDLLVIIAKERGT
jgi:hypothetical protein